MKSAYELALEKAGIAEIKELSQGKKEKIAELERIYKAKKAEAELMMKHRLEKAVGNFDDIERIKKDFEVEIASFDSKLKREKDKIRNS